MLKWLIILVSFMFFSSMSYASDGLQKMENPKIELEKQSILQVTAVKADLQALEFQKSFAEKPHDVTCKRSYVFNRRVRRFIAKQQKRSFYKYTHYSGPLKILNS